MCIYIKIVQKEETAALYILEGVVDVEYRPSLSYKIQNSGLLARNQKHSSAVGDIPPAITL